jgi:hypothetical protein
LSQALTSIPRFFGVGIGIGIEASLFRPPIPMPTPTPLVWLNFQHQS